MSELRQQMIDAMVLRGFADRTQTSYVAAVRGLAKHFHRSPDELSNADVQQFLLHHLNDGTWSYSTCNLTLNAVRFLFREVLKRSPNEICLPGPKQPQRLPEILSREEVVRLLDAAKEPKYRVLLMTTYAAGLRVSEVCGLHVRDIDSDRMTIRVNQGKGGRDRYTLLSNALLDQLRRYWQTYRPREWLFVRTDGVSPMSIGTAQKVFYAARNRAGIKKRIGIHGLRHAFATHLMESGVDINTIQRLMGHRSVRTTMRYFHLSQGRISGTHSPFELLEGAKPPPH